MKKIVLHLLLCAAVSGYAQVTVTSETTSAVFDMRNATHGVSIPKIEDDRLAQRNTLNLGELFYSKSHDCITIET